MDNEKEQQLREYLNSLGFTGAYFSEQLHKKLALYQPNFSLNYKVDFGEEQMRFKLRFTRDLQFDAYRLEQYEAVHRAPVTVAHSVINGVNTEALAQQMALVNWEVYFDNGNTGLPAVAHERINRIMDDLLKLQDNHNFDGRNAQQMLQYKYWPEQAYDEPLMEVKSAFEKSRSFSAGEYGTCNVNMAYLILSGRFDDIYEKLSCLALDEYPGIDLNRLLDSKLTTNPDNFEIHCSRNQAEGFAEYTIPVAKADGWYAVDSYTVSLTPYPAIEHGVYSGIDTQELEKAMQQIDWHKDKQLFIFRDDQEPEILPNVALLQEQIYHLSRDMAGMEIADYLQVKYWADAPYFEGLIEQSGWDYLESLPKKEQQFPTDITAKAAFNLLCGRACVNTLKLDPMPGEEAWIRVDTTCKTEAGIHPIAFITGFPERELEARLDVLPIDSMHFYPIRNALKQGDLLLVTLNDDRKVFLEANPEAKTINIYTPDMRPILTNLALDPDWHPQIAPAQKMLKINPTDPQKAVQKPFTISHKKQKKGRRM